MARVGAPLLLPVAQPGGSGSRSAASPRRGGPGPPPSAGRIARESRERIRPPLSRSAAPGRLRPASPSGPRPPRPATVPAMARSRPGGSGWTPTQRWLLPAAFPAPFSFASLLLPAPPHRNGEPSPTRVPRRSRRRLDRFPALTAAREAATAAGSPLSASTRGRGAPRRRVAPRRRRGRSGCSAGSSTALQDFRAASVRELRPRARAFHLHRQHRQRRWGANSPFPGLQHPRGHGDGPRCASADAIPGVPSSRARRGRRHRRAREDDLPPPRFFRLPGRALRPIRSGLFSARHLPWSGIRVATSTPIQQPPGDLP